MTRVDIAEVHKKVHLWTYKVPSVDPKNEIILFLFLISDTAGIWSSVHGSPVPKQLDHGGQLALQKVYCSLY